MKRRGVRRGRRRRRKKKKERKEGLGKDSGEG